LGFLMRAIVALVLAVCSTWLFVQPACAEKRVALVLGNSAYQNVNRLANPANDSSAIAETLKSAGFDGCRPQARFESCRDAARLARLF
jgi:hypothetical protein